MFLAFSKRFQIIFEAFMRVFGGRGYKKVDLQITSAGNQGQVRVNLRITSRDVDTIIKSFISNSFTSTLNRGNLSKFSPNFSPSHLRASGR